MQFGRTRAVLLSGVVACSALALGAAWFLREDHAVDGGARSRAAKDRSAEAGAVPAAAAADRKPAEDVAKSAAAETDANGDDADAEFRGTGSVLLTVVDAATGEPIADLPFVCWSERPRTHVYARNVTDAKGQAELANLPEDVVIFETARVPPHANTLFATWLPDGRRREVTMRVGRGGTIRGRVVDDAGQPLEGVTVKFDARPARQMLEYLKSITKDSPELAERFKRNPDVVMKTSADGRFEAGALLSRFGAIWIRNGVADPKTEEPIELLFTWRQSGAIVTAKVRDGETVEAPDVVIARARTFAGKVLEQDGTPVAGALVTASMRRAMALVYRPLDTPMAKDRAFFLEQLEDFDLPLDQRPGEAGFTLNDEEALTANDGSFEVEVTSRCAAVATNDGRIEMFEWPTSAPGSRTEGVEFRLLPEVILSLTLTESNGQPLASSAPRGGPNVLAVTDRGAEAPAEIQHGPPGRFGARWYRLASERVVGLVVDLQGYERRRVEWHPSANGRNTLTLDLVPRAKHVVKLRLKLHDAKEMAALKQVNAEVEACLLPPERRLAKADGTPRRCGLDAERWFEFHPVVDLDLDVANDREWHLYLNGPFVADSKDFAHAYAGVFHPDGERHEVGLPPVSLAWLAERERLRQEERARQEAPPAPRREFAKVRFAAVDAVSNAPLDQAQVSAKSDAAASDWASSVDSASDGAVTSWLPVGHHVARVSAPDHRDSVEIDYTAAVNETVDLGTVRLEPLPRFKMKLVARDGSESSGRYDVRVRSGGAARGWFCPADANGVATGPGLFELRSDLPDRFTLTVALIDEAARGGVGNGWSQHFDVERWSPDETKEFALARWHPVTFVVDLSGIAEDLRRATFGLRVDRAGAAADGPTQDDSSNGVESRDTDPHERRYRYLLPSDRWVAHGANGLFAIPDTPFEITDEQDDVTIRIAAR